MKVKLLFKLITFVVLIFNIFLVFPRQGIAGRSERSEGVNHKVRELSVGEWVNLVTFSPDADLFAAASVKNSVRVWKTANWVAAYDLKHPSTVTDCEFSPTQKVVATVTNELIKGGMVRPTIRFWDTEKGRIISVFSEKEMPQGITSIAYSPNGRSLAVGFGGGLLKLLNLEKLSAIKAINEKMLALDSGISLLSFSPDGNYLAVSTGKGISGPEDSMLLKVLDIQNGTELLTKKNLSITGMAFSSDGSIFAVQGTKGTSNQRVSTVELLNSRSWLSQDQFEDQTSGIDLEFSHDGHFLVSTYLAERKSKITFWDWRKKRAKFSIIAHKDATSFDLSSDGRYVAVGNEHGKIQIHQILEKK
jgi:WD40 repeat protein